MDTEKRHPHLLQPAHPSGLEFAELESGVDPGRKIVAKFFRRRGKRSGPPNCTNHRVIERPVVRTRANLQPEQRAVGADRETYSCGQIVRSAGNRPRFFYLIL